MNKRFLHLSTLAIAVALSGCAATVKQSSLGSSPTASVSKASAAQARGAVAIVLTASDELRQSSDWASLTNDWQELVPDAASELHTSANFIASESALTSNQTMLVRVKVNDFRYMSTAKRFLMGVLAGNAYLDLDVEYVQLPGMQVLSTKKINTSSSAWEGIFSAVTPKQVYAVSRLVLTDAIGVNGAK
jgi:hypothetical protein